MTCGFTRERPAFTHEGTRTTCRNGTATFTARFQR
jgi:hypothetical protein